MKVVFVGGGAHRLLGILRKALQEGVFHDGEIVLYDLDASRAQTLGELLKLTPEYRSVQCQITWDADLDSALEGADAVGVILMGGTRISYLLGEIPAREHGYLSSDNISPNGAFLAAKAAPILLDIARRMEQKCPNAWLINFANPIAPLSGMVNRFTRIRALGVCAGYVNHQWDINRLLGSDCWSSDFDLEVAGINHLSFIVNGTMPSLGGGERIEILPTVKRALGTDWKAPELQAFWPDSTKAGVSWGLKFQAEIFQDLGTLIFSTERDGMIHLRYEDQLAAIYAGVSQPTVEKVKEFHQRQSSDRGKANAEFAEALSIAGNDAFWEDKEGTVFDRVPDDIFVRVLRGLASDTGERVVCSYQNNGAVKGLPENSTTEYSQILNRNGISSTACVEVPPSVYGIVSGLAMHQTLLAEACATDDPALFAQALLAYPVRPCSNGLKRLCRELLKINHEQLLPGFQRTGEFLTIR